MADDEAQIILDKLVAERGGAPAFDVAAMAAARALATVLASGTADARAIASLNELLPARRAAGAADGGLISAI